MATNNPSRRRILNNTYDGTGAVVTTIKTEQLEFDPENPRFYRLNDASSETQVIDEMLDEEGVTDLMLSIGQKGYFEGEPLLVVSPSGAAPFIVVEGNRRLAAVKLLNGEIQPPNRRRKSIDRIREEAEEADFPTELPCLIYKERREVLRYLGYRHITGIKEWDALSKAKYLSELRNEFYNDYDLRAQMKALANDIGSRSDYVAQLLTALALYVKAENTKKFFGLPITAQDIEFSYLTTALNYSNICEWLGLEGKGDVEMENLKADNLKRAFSWFFSKNQDGHTVLGETRNLQDLASIVRSKRAVAVLESSKNLSEAYLYTDGPQKALETVLEQALEKVATVWRMLPETSAITSIHNELARQLSDEAKQVRTAIMNRLEE